MNISVWKELEQRVRSRGVRVEERLALLRRLERDAEEHQQPLRRQLEELEGHIERSGKEVREALR